MKQYWIEEIIMELIIGIRELKGFLFQNTVNQD